MPLVKLGDVEINYRVMGDGEPLMMIMGFSSPMIGWYFQAPFFRRYYRVVMFDNRGVGKSSKPQGPYTTAMMADDTVHLMDHLGIERACVMGASMGGMIAQELAINHSERVNKLVLVCTSAGQDEASGVTPEMIRLFQLAPAKTVRAIMGLAFNKPLYRLFFGSIGRLMSIFTSTSGDVGIEGQSAACATHNTFDRLGMITANTLVIVGEEDRLIKPASSELIAAKIPGSKLVKIEGGSHTFMVENRDEFNRKVLEFLRDESATR